jgi:hypothetical protein
MHILGTSRHVFAGQWQLLLEAIDSEEKVKDCLSFIRYFLV